MLEVGTVLAGKFRVERVLGQGGMGVVVVATHLQLEQTVALKFLHEHIAQDAAVVERLIREARASAKLKSEHACRVMDVGQLENGTPYIVMELLAGQDLSQLCHQQVLSPQVAADYVLQACVAIAEAHAAGIVHRDLKPSNLFLTERLDGTPLVKVLDFGIAKATSKDGFEITRTSAVMGSPGYMSPEQIRSAKDVDARTDIWSLGAILYELVSARIPFRAESITELAVKIAMDPFDPIQTDPAYLAIIQRCLQKPIDQRYQSVAALAVDLAKLAGPRGMTSATMIARLSGQQQLFAAGTQSPPGASPAELGWRATEPIGVEAATPPRRDPTPRLPPREGAITTLGGAAGATVPEPRTRSRAPLFAIVGLLVVGGIAAGIYALQSGGDPKSSTATLASPPTATDAFIEQRVERTRVIVQTHGGADQPAKLVLGTETFDGKPDQDKAAIRIVFALDVKGRFLDTKLVAKAGGTVSMFEQANRWLMTTSFVADQPIPIEVFALENREAKSLFRGTTKQITSKVLGERKDFTADRFGFEATMERLFESLAPFDGRTVMVVLCERANRDPALIDRANANHVELYVLGLDVGTETWGSATAAKFDDESALEGFLERIGARIKHETAFVFDIPTTTWKAARSAMLDHQKGAALVLDGQTTRILAPASLGERVIIDL